MAAIMTSTSVHPVHTPTAATVDGAAGIAGAAVGRA